MSALLEIRGEACRIDEALACGAPAGDAKALAAAMARTLDDPPPRERQRRRGDDFSLERSATRYLKLLLEGAPQPTTRRNPGVGPIGFRPDGRAP